MIRVHWTKNRTWDRWRTYFLSYDTLLLWANAQGGSADEPDLFHAWSESRYLVQIKLFINSHFQDHQQIIWRWPTWQWSYIINSHFHESANKAVRWPHLTMKLMVFSHPEEHERDETEKGTASYSQKVAAASAIWWTRKETNASLVLSFYIYRKEGNSLVPSRKIIFVLSYSQGEKWVLGKMMTSIWLLSGQ